MRTALASLIATAAIVTVAHAQTPAAPAPQAAPPAPSSAPATPAPGAATAPTPAAPTPGTTAPTPAAPAPGTTAAPTPGTTTTPAPDATAAPPSLPTTGDGAAIISLVEKVCVPLVRGGSLDDLAKVNSALGLKKNRRDGSWTMPLGADKNFNVTIFTPGANRDVCRAEVHYAVDEEKPIVSAVNIWSFLHQPELLLQANYVAVDADGIKRVRKSWEHLDSTSSTAINFSTWTKPDDTSLNAKFSTGEIFYQERKF